MAAPRYPSCQAEGFDFIDLAGHATFGIEEPSGCGLFSNSSCVPKSYGQPAASSQCCTQTFRDTASSASTYNFAENLTWLGGLPLMVWIGWKWWLKRKALKVTNAERAKKGLPPLVSGCGDPELDPDYDPISVWISANLPLGGLFQKIYKSGFALNMVVSIYVMMFMANSIQGTFTISDRNAIAATSAVLVPFRLIFQFLEDTVTVQINYSVATNNHRRTNTIFWNGIRSSMLLGLLASAIGTFVVESPELLAAIVGAGAEHDSELFPNCTLLGSATEVSGNVKGYFLLSVWQYSFAFCNMVFTGLLFGTGQMKLWGIIAVTGEAALLATWIPLQRTPTLLGIAYLLQVAVVTLFCAVVLYLHTPLRKKIGLAAPWAASTGSDSDKARKSKEDATIRRELLVDGLCILAMDMSLQLSGTITYFVALTHSAATAYQLNALGAALPQFGLAWVLSIRYFTKIWGSQLLATAQYAQFASFAKASVVATLVTAAWGVVNILWHSDALAYNYAMNGCEFAGSTECFPIYEKLFLGKGNVKDNFPIAAAAIFIDSAFNVTRGLILACKDFKFIAIAAVTSFIFVYVPAILIAIHFYSASARSLYVASLMPMSYLTATHWWRTRANLSAMMAGRSGPWAHGINEPSSDGTNPYTGASVGSDGGLGMPLLDAEQDGAVGAGMSYELMGESDN